MRKLDSNFRSHIQDLVLIIGSLLMVLVQKVETTQNDIIRLILGLRKPKSAKFLLTESGLSIINERLKFLLINYLTRTLANSSHTLRNRIRNPSMHRGITNEYAKTQKKFPVPAKSSASTFNPPPPLPPWNWSILTVNNNFSKWTKIFTPIAFVQKKKLKLIQLHIQPFPFFWWVQNEWEGGKCSVMLCMQSKMP